MWSDLFLASGGVINWNNGDVTATHSANTLAFAGASSGYTFDAAVTCSTTLAVTSNATVGGTLGVTGVLTANASAGITGRNTAKAFVYFVTDGSANVTINGSFNVTSVAVQTVETLAGWRVTFTNALPSANYVAVCNGRVINSAGAVTFFNSSKATTTFDFFLQAVGSGGGIRNSINCDLLFFDAS
jgi:hypothetical protein